MFGKTQEPTSSLSIKEKPRIKTQGPPVVLNETCHLLAAEEENDDFGAREEFTDDEDWQSARGEDDEHEAMCHIDISMYSQPAVGKSDGGSRMCAIPESVGIQNSINV